MSFLSCREVGFGDATRSFRMAISRRLKALGRSPWVALAFSTCLLSAATDGAHAQQAVTLRLSSFHPERATFSRAVKAWTEEVTKRTNENLKFQLFWGGSLLAAVDTLPGVRDGRADLGFTGAVYHPSMLSLSMIDSLPFISGNTAAVGYAFTDMYVRSDALRAEYEQNGIVLMGYAPVSPDLFFSKRPVRDLAELKGLRARTLGYAADALNAAGAYPIGLPQTQVYEALEKGLLDASFGAGLDLGVDFDFQTLAKYISDPNFGVWAHGSLIMNKNVYDRLDPKSRKVLDEMRPEFTRIYVELLKTAEDEACKTVKTKGAMLDVWPRAETDRWKALLGDAARKKWLASQRYADASAFLTEFETRIREYEKSTPWVAALQRCIGR